jgi:hypothetical protein
LWNAFANVHLSTSFPAEFARTFHAVPAVK